MNYKITIETQSENGETINGISGIITSEMVSHSQVDIVPIFFKELWEKFQIIARENESDAQCKCSCPMRLREREELLVDVCLDCGKPFIKKWNHLTKPYGY